MSKPLFPYALLVTISLSACSTVVDNLPGVYTLEIQQGNIIDQDMVNQLKPGMTKRQVIFIMGSPMLTDYFHQKRWDYLYYDKKSGADKEQKRISLFFSNDQVVGIQGDFKPGAESSAKIPKESNLELPKREVDRTIWEKISSLFY